MKAAEFKGTEFKATPSGRIPKEWEVVKLKEVIADIKNGFASGKRDENGIVQIRMNNVTIDGKLIFDSYLKVPIPQPLNEWLLEKDDFLFNNTNSIDLVGKSAIFKGAPFPCTFSNHFTRIRFRRDLVLSDVILYHFLILWGKGYFKSVAIRHVGQSAVHTKYLLNLKLPLPPLPEQQKIAEILSTVDEAIEKTDQAIGKTQRLKKGLVQELLTKAIGHKESKDTGTGRIPQEWEIKKLGEVALEIYRYPTYYNIKYMNEGIPEIRGEMIKVNGELENDLTKYRYISNETSKKFPRTIVKEGDFVMSVRGTMGKIAIVSKKLEGANITANLMRISLNHSKCYPNFFKQVFLSEKFQKMLNLLSPQTTIKTIQAPKLKSLKLPLPPLPEQQKIAEILSTTDKRLELLRARREKLERIKKGLMNDLLTGKKRVLVDSIPFEA